MPTRREVLIGGVTGIGALVVGGVGSRFLEGSPSTSTAPAAPTGEPVLAPTDAPVTLAPSASASPDKSATQRPASINWEKPKPAEALRLGWTDGKYQTFPRIIMAGDNTEGRVLQEIDLGTLGPDVDTIAGIDFPGDIPTGAAIVHQPTEGPILETRVVFIKRTDIETVQFHGALGGDRFDIYRASAHGGDKALDVTARLHAANTARKHQKVVYLGDLGLFEEQWGKGEQPLLNTMIRAQRLSKAGIQEPDFVQPRIFVK
ncbi:MAG: hypothetical protein M1405_01125 [Patescibacteria group bacterium]|nr:hypothetical protein [Patescibacteria group bacterium]